MSVNYFDYNYESNWVESANSYYQRFIEPDITPDAIEAIISWGEESDYNASIVIDYFDLDEDDEDIDIHEARDGVYNALCDCFFNDDYIEFAEDNDIDFDVSYMVAIDNGQFVHFKSSCLDAEDEIMEEARIALEKEGFDAKYKGHEAILIGVNGTEQRGIITDKGLDTNKDKIKNKVQSFEKGD